MLIVKYMYHTTVHLKSIILNNYFGCYDITILLYPIHMDTHACLVAADLMSR